MRQYYTSASSPTAKAAAIEIELLDEPPRVMRKPLTLISGQAYAAMWPHVQVTINEEISEDRIIKHDPPLVKTTQSLMIVREDGRTFGEHGDEPLENLKFEVSLPDAPQPDKLLSVSALKEYQPGFRPAPAEIFERLCEVIDRFIDFDKSIASQREMCELIACYIVATWFMDAFNVAGFLWPNGERGSGKTQLLSLIAQLGYLGQLLLAGSSYATLRDLADYGGMICFDDAENLSDPQRTDADKRALLLAGNRRGNTVALKEQAPDKTWRTRHVSTFCPRAFSAINLPDAVLATRTIVIPLIKTADRSRANADPLDFAKWPVHPRELVDGLWCMALANLARLPTYDEQVGREAGLMGRDLEPWRAVLAVAAFLQDSRVDGLWERMNTLSQDYQVEREEFESGDLNTLVIRALRRLLGCGKCLDCEVVKLCEVCEVSSRGTRFILTGDIEKTAKEIAQNGILDIDGDQITSRKIGKLLSKLRFRSRREGGSGRSGWQITFDEVEKWARKLGVSKYSGVALLPTQSEAPSQSSQTSHG